MKIKDFFLMTPKKFKRIMKEQFAKPEGVAGDFFTLAMNVINFKLYNAVYNFVGKDEGSKILDVGFGNGDMLKRLDEKLDNVKLYGVDISDHMVVVATSVNQDAVDKDRMFLQNASVEELPYDDDYFDTVYTINTIYFWQDREKSLSEILRVLRPGGKFICAFYSRDYFERKKQFMSEEETYYSPRELRDVISDAGFDNAKIKVVDSKKFMYCLVCEKRGNDADADKTHGPQQL
ncbi:class I SAM-dependent methyltransferase [Ruminococcus sp. FC2018]|uniref:class I SAM-dependent methyltransferase n=1 Tax=Ruminococcus sp. FC2018 TaxID=1410617 RepID=UPI0006846510|nr:class I SAM-dependent methyltransferase [Ruminococcus sp. FC2018]